MNGVQIYKRGLVMSIGLATWRLLVVVKSTVSKDPVGKKPDWEVLQNE